MDSFYVKAIALELKSKIIGVRIGKPWVVDPFRLILPLSASTGTLYLYCSCNPSLPLLYVTNVKPDGHGKESSQSELLFRKYLTNAVITSIDVPPMERIIFLHLELKSKDLPADHPHMTLVIEIMARHANLILTTDKGEILAALRYVHAYQNRYRQILIGGSYILPPASKKINPQTLDQKGFLELLKSFDGSVPMDKFLHQKISGLDLLIFKEICYRAGCKMKNLEQDEALWKAFAEILEIYNQGNFFPGIIHIDKDKIKLWSFHLEQYDSTGIPDQVFSCAGEAAEYFEEIQSAGEDLKSLQNLMIQNIQVFLEKSKNRLTALEKDYKEASQAEGYREKADLIMANLHKIQKGQDHVKTENFYHEESTLILISLDPKLTPPQNAQRYYKKYNKGKNALLKIEPRLETTKKEISFLTSLMEKIAHEENLTVLEEYKNLLKEKRLISPEKGSSSIFSFKSNNEKSLLKDIRRYFSVDGFEILVGRNDRGNDTLTCKIAQKFDLWLHTQDVPGSHVLVRNPERLAQIPFSTIMQAASLAAWFSRAREDTKVMVDYAFKRYVTKPKGAKPGLVLVSQKNSILVPPKNIV